MKRLIFSCLLLLCWICASAQVMTEHVVKRGETVSSIAEAYGVSQEAIYSANPSARQFVYIGMKLMIPSVPQSTTGTDAASEDATPVKEPVKQSVVEQPGISELFSVPKKEERDYSQFFISYVIPFAKGEYDAKWGIEMIGTIGKELDYNLFSTFSPLDMECTVFNTKGPGWSDNLVFMWPLQLGFGTPENNLRVGGFLGWVAMSDFNDGEKTYGIKDMKKEGIKVDRFRYGFRFDMTLVKGIKIGYRMSYYKKAEKPSNALSIGIAF